MAYKKDVKPAITATPRRPEAAENAPCCCTDAGKLLSLQAEGERFSPFILQRTNAHLPMRRTRLLPSACLALALAAATLAAQARGFKTEELWIDNGPRRIYGVMASPEGAEGRLPVAIVAHGFNGTHHFARAYFDTLCSLGYRCYAFDFPCGSLKSRSDSNTMDMSVRDEAADIEAIVAHFRSRADTDTAAIALIGESQGGLASALAAASLRGAVSRMVLIYPALCIPDNWNAAYKTEADIPDTTRVWGVPLGRRFFIEARAIDVYATIGHYRGPVLLLHGDRDTVVPLDYSRRAEAVYPDARLHVISGAGHGFDGKSRREAVSLVAAFLAPGAGKTPAKPSAPTGKD